MLDVAKFQEMLKEFSKIKTNLFKKIKLKKYVTQL